jgi:hypothetical protein
MCGLLDGFPHDREANCDLGTSQESKTMRSLLAVAALAATLLLHAPFPARGADSASFDDTARFLAGMPPSPDSPLAPLTREASWQQHAKHFDAAWAGLESRQLANVRAWTSRNMTAPRQTLFYMFSGPDYLYANAFFPDASTYVLSGLERTGPIPDVMKLRGSALPAALGHLKASLRQVLSHSYFITSEMGAHLARGQLNGTLPLLYVFLARSGKSVRDVSYVQLEPDGTIKPYEASSGPAAIPRAVKIVFSGSGGKEQTLYYFSTNLANDGVAKSGFLKFCEALGTGDSFVKSASYLLHSGGFSGVREFMLKRSTHILQDDTGIPVSHFKEDAWSLQPYGRYSRPIPVFARNYQPRLKTLFDQGKPGALDFGIGYKWRAGQSNLMLATRKGSQAEAGR